MRRIIAGVFQSLDGVMQAPGGPTEDPTKGFKYGGWMAKYDDDIVNATLGNFFKGPYDLLLGRKTYEIFAAYWPFMPDSDEIAGPFNKCNKYVLTHGNDTLEWANSQRLPDIEAVKKLKATNGPDLIIQGSSTIYPALLAENLIDRLMVMTFPLVLGKGKTIFGEGTPAFAMKVVDSQISPNGVIITTYEPAGKVQTGTIGPEVKPSPAEIKRQERMKKEG